MQRAFQVSCPPSLARGENVRENALQPILFLPLIADNLPFQIKKAPQIGNPRQKRFRNPDRLEAAIAGLDLVEA
jgi:hypothetical protein